MQTILNKPRQIPAKQKGMSALSFMFFVAIFVFVLLSVLKVVPIYIENMSIQSILEGVKEEFTSSTKQPTKSEIKTLLQKRFNINQIKRLSAKDIQINKEKEHYVVLANYESRIDFIANIDVVVVFENNTIEIPIK